MSKWVLQTTMISLTFVLTVDATASPAFASVSAVCTSISANIVPVTFSSRCSGDCVLRRSNSKCRNSPRAPVGSLMNTPCWPFHFSPLRFGRESTSAIFVQPSSRSGSGRSAALP